jgi:histidyl-tRNA synthetase
LSRLEIKGFTLLLNSVGCANCRPKFVEHLRRALQGVAAGMCADCRRRAENNPLRVLDCKVEADQPIIEKLPNILDHLCEACRAHFDRVQQYLRGGGIDFEIRPRLVRGLDYYTRTTFEVVHGALGAQDSVLGGGRYDGLAEALGSKIHAPGIGFSIGEDRLVMTLEENRPASLDLCIAALGEAAAREMSGIARHLRRESFSVELLTEGGLRRLLELANKLGARYTLIAGDEELILKSYKLKNMSTGDQESVTTADQIAERLRR